MQIDWVLLHANLNHCLETSYGGEQRLISWTFWHIKTTNVDQTIKCTCSTIMGTRDVHSIQYIDSMDVNKPSKKKLGLILLYLCRFRFLNL
jgi:hypothetical protein